MMRGFVLPAIIMALLFCVAGCGSGSGRGAAEQVAMEYARALFSKNTDQALKLVYLPEQINVLVSDKMLRDLLQAFLEQIPDEATKNLKVEAVKSEVKDDKAEVILKISAGGRVSEEAVHLVNIDGWKVLPDFVQPPPRKN